MLFNAHKVSIRDFYGLVKIILTLSLSMLEILIYVLLFFRKAKLNLLAIKSHIY